MNGWGEHRILVKNFGLERGTELGVRPVFARVAFPHEQT